MFLSKKSVLKSLLVIGLLGMPQKSQSIVGEVGLAVLTIATIGVPVSIGYCTGVWFNRHTNSSSFLKTQDEINHYHLNVSLYPKNNRFDKKTVVFEGNDPQKLITQIILYAEQNSSKNIRLQVDSQITLKNNKNIPLRDIKIPSTNTQLLEKNLIQRLIISEKHLTYKGKLLSGALAGSLSCLFVELVGPLLFFI